MMSSDMVALSSDDVKIKVLVDVSRTTTSTRALYIYSCAI